MLSHRLGSAQTPETITLSLLRIQLRPTSSSLVTRTFASSRTPIRQF